MKLTLNEVKAMNEVAGTQLTKEQEIAFIKNRLNELKFGTQQAFDSYQKQPINEGIIAAIVAPLAVAVLGIELFSGDASGQGAISRAIDDIKRKWRGEPTNKEIWAKVVKDDEIRKFVRDNASDIVKKGKGYKSRELEDLIKKYVDSENKK